MRSALATLRLGFLRSHRTIRAVRRFMPSRNCFSPTAIRLVQRHNVQAQPPSLPTRSRKSLR
jgi:hypothetical protein